MQAAHTRVAPYGAEIIEDSLAQRRSWWLGLLYVPAYVALDWISYIQPVLKLGITPWSPQTGLTVAFLIWKGPRWGVCTAIAALLAELLVRDAPAGVPWLMLASVWIAASYAALAAVLGRNALRDVMQGVVPAVRFTCAALLAAMIAGIGYVGTFVLAHSLPLSSAAGSVVRYWVGDVNATLMIAPLLLALPQLRSALRALRTSWAAATAQVVVLASFVWLLFGVDDLERLRFFYPLFLPMIWVAVRWGVPGALLAALTIQVGIIFAMRDSATDAPLIDLQILMLTLTVTGLLLGAAVAERAQARREAQERERQLALAMRFAVAGELASALTHELNQPITALVSYLQASQIMSIPVASNDTRLADTLTKATNEAIRASQVLRRLRDFYQGGGAGKGPAQLATCCSSVVELLDPRLRTQRIRLQLSLPNELPPVRADRSQIEMVLHNLLNNAIDALGAVPAANRELRLRAEQEETFVRLIIEDSGPGVHADALEQLFEPFNTTKSDGMGLGLAISHNLMRAQGGDLTYRRSTQLGGACFEIRFPAFK
jgi:two-component system, LuxR family, sensor kinase FixL